MRLSRHSPFSAGVGPVKDLVHGCHPVLAQRHNVTTCQDSIVHPRVNGKTLKGREGEMINNLLIPQYLLSPIREGQSPNHSLSHLELPHNVIGPSLVTSPFSGLIVKNGRPSIAFETYFSPSCCLALSLPT